MIWNREAETMSREARERLQLERLGETIAWAVARVPFFVAPRTLPRSEGRAVRVIERGGVF